MRRTLSVLAATMVALGLCICARASADTRGVTVQLRASEAAGAPVAETVKLYGASHVLLMDAVYDYFTKREKPPLV